MAELRRQRSRKGLFKLEEVAGCEKKRPPADLLWLFSRVAEANSGKRSSEARKGVDSHEHPRLLFQPLQAGTEGVSLLDQQTYRQWRSFIGLQRLSHPRRLRQRTIIIQPFISPSLPGYTLGEVESSVLEYLQHLCSAFFTGMSIELASPLDLTAIPNLTSRVHQETRRTQYLVGDILRFLERRRPRYAQCVMAVTTVDLYPSSEWNFVLGHASLTSGCGVFGFGRYFSSLFSESVPTLSQQLEQLWVLARVVSHELCHTLGLKHCYYFSCAMNESASIEQAAAQPLFLCPVCLRKLKKLLRFDIFKRYALLKEAISKMLQANQPLEESSQESQVGLFLTNTADKPRVSEMSVDTQSAVDTSNTVIALESYSIQLEPVVHTELISSLLVQESPLNGSTQLLSLQQALQWLDRVKETKTHIV